MAPMKRRATSMKRAMKRSRANKDVPTVVNALVHSDALPENLRSVLKGALPIALDANKADRHAYETEVVDQAQQALKAVQAAMEQSKAAALKKQNEMITPAERARRINALKQAEAHREELKGKLEACKAATKAAEAALGNTKDALKAAQKEEKAAAKDLQHRNDKHAHASQVLETQFAMLRDGTGTPGDVKKAVDSVVRLGKEHGLDGTLMATLPITCKKAVDHRTEFERMMFANLQGLIQQSIASLAASAAEAQPVAQAKASAVEVAQATFVAAQGTLKAAEEDQENTQNSLKDANKQVHQADAHRRKLWNDMRHVCDEADGVSADLQNLTENIFAIFQKLKEKEPEPEPAPPVEETAAETQEAGEAAADA